MNTTPQKILTELGLDEKQARVYLSLFELGEASVQEIADYSHIKRTSIYSILDQLKKLNLVYPTKVKNQSFFVAEDPTKVLKKYKEKIEMLAEQVELLNTVRKESDHKSRILFFDGKEGFKKIWEILLDSDMKEFLIIVDPREMLGFIKQGYIKGHIISEKVKRGIKSRQLVTSSEYVKEIVAKDKQENRISKFLPHFHKTPFTTIIFGDKVALISPHLENMMFIIESESFARTQRALFETLWEKLPEHAYEP
ncbi:MAG TPA: helix-turn-helix domain-containing protein [Patescibacteria group bacterium]|nr:helix-turn-helix domain-containing protein [Patescibacteria group bacterium]